MRRRRCVHGAGRESPRSIVDLGALHRRLMRSLSRREWHICVHLCSSVVSSLCRRPAALVCGIVPLAAAALGGCAAEAPPPTVPVIAALSATGDYGYSEEALASDRYTVTYVTPSLSAHGEPDQDYGLAPERQLASDLALLRAAELALEKGYPAFRVESESRDLELDIVDPPGPPPFVSAAMRTLSGPPCRWNCDNPIGYWDDPYFNPAYDNWYRRAHSSGRAAATMTVTLLPHPAPGAEDAAATAKRLRQAYVQSVFDVR
jgi:hypothetical protein